MEEQTFDEALRDFTLTDSLVMANEESLTLALSELPPQKLVLIQQILDELRDAPEYGE